jgi:hypothetical protein
MASEITTRVQLTATKGSLSVKRDSGSTVIDMSGTHKAAGAMDIPTTAGGTAIPLGSVSTAGLSYFRNLDATNYLTIGVVVSATFYPLVKLKAGESCLLRLGTNAPYALANTATCVLEYEVLEA